MMTPWHFDQFDRRQVLSEIEAMLVPMMAKRTLMHSCLP